MQPLLLDSKTPDELLLERLNMACANEAERKNKKRCLASQTAKNPVKELKAKIPPELLTELAELETGVASLKGLSAEIAQIKETLQQPVPDPQSYAPPPVMQYDKDQQQRQYYSFHCPRQRAPLPQYPVQHYTGSPARRERRCHICQQNGVNERCTHCYLCGSREHFQAGCRSRGMRPYKEKHLNHQWLPPRDER